MNDIPDSLNRRQFLGAGFALAVLPVTGWTITTSAKDLEAGPVRIPTDGGSMPGYWAMPRGKGPFPVVLVVHEIFGVHEYIQDVCRRLAKEGYLAISPYLYFREGDVTKIEDVRSVISQVVSKVDPARVWSDLDATVAFVRKSGKGDSDKLGITGFCWGGSVVWTYAARHPKLKAGVAWYGRLTSAHGPGSPKTPIDVAGDLKAPVLGLYGGKDTGIPVSDVEKMRQALKQAKSKAEIVVYPEAQHGFHADYRPSYDEKAARDGWAKMLAWFREHGMR